MIIHVIRFKTWRNKNYFSVRVLYTGIHFSLYQSLVISIYLFKNSQLSYVEFELEFGLSNCIQI